MQSQHKVIFNHVFNGISFVLIFCVSKHAYRLWAHAHHFDSMLPDDTRARKLAAAEAAQAKAKVQGTLDGHTKPIDPPPTPYSDETFANAVIDWACATNQVCLLMSVGSRDEDIH